MYRWVDPFMACFIDCVSNECLPKLTIRCNSAHVLCIPVSWVFCTYPDSPHNKVHDLRASDCRFSNSFHPLFPMIKHENLGRKVVQRSLSEWYLQYMKTLSLAATQKLKAPALIGWSMEIPVGSYTFLHVGFCAMFGNNDFAFHQKLTAHSFSFTLNLRN